MLGRAAATVAAEQSGGRPLAVIGRDTRRSGPMLGAALAAGICSAGADVIRLGVVSTPAVAFATRYYQADFGVMISASHNSAPDNGIKFFSRDGYKLPDSAEDRLESLVRSQPDTMPRPTGAGVGDVREDDRALAAYVDHVVGTGASLAGKRIVIDCGHGAAYQLSPEVFRRLGAEVIALHTAPDGLNINDGCGSTHPERLQQAVLEHGADAGIAHDGDADRCIAVDERGELVDGDQLMAIAALDLEAQGRLKDRTFVATVMSNLGLELLMRSRDIKVLKANVGDRYVLEEMLRTGAVLGGEQSGHVIFGEYSTTGDGILTAVQTLSALVRSGKSMSELAGQMKRLPQVMVNVRVKSKEGWDVNPAITEAIRRASQALGDRGRVLVRPSGTEPLIRVMMEGPEEAEITRLAEEVKEVIAAELS